MSDKLAMLSSTSDAFINDISDELSPSHYSKIETTALSMFFFQPKCFTLTIRSVKQCLGSNKIGCFRCICNVGIS